MSNVTEIQVVKCRCGAIFAACSSPECFQDPEWMKDVRKYSKSGYLVEMKKPGEWTFGKCTCNLFQEINQLPLL